MTTWPRTSGRRRALLTYAELLGEGPREVTGWLITGPGGCLALTMRDRPQLLVFPPDTTLTTGRPSVQGPADTAHAIAG